MNIRMDAIYEGNVSGYGQVNQGRYVTGSESWEKLQQRNAQKIEEFNQKGIEAWKETKKSSIVGGIMGGAGYLATAAFSSNPITLTNLALGIAGEAISGAISTDVASWVK
ncbi:hypothetical protein [Marinitoga litoralis]|uniref:hypothetical protein n=1 Tax=Marinitoga litoralis TaxID=570855 RepID=UPI001960AAB1|nr:hypothetical protein [Marinitoga litoralis]MBM7558851.1 hypothetical protein [Marinitoga litoralis]